MKPSQLIGANRRYMEARLPHLQWFLFDTAPEAIDRADLAVVSSSDAGVIEALLTNPPSSIIDLSGRLGPAVEVLEGYEGVGV